MDMHPPKTGMHITVQAFERHGIREFLPNWGLQFTIHGAIMNKMMNKLLEYEWAKVHSSLLCRTERRCR